MSHDVLAELDGYRNELANAERQGRDERAAAVQAEIDRVKTQVEARAVALETTAQTLKDTGQDVKGAELSVEARRYRDALADPGADLETATDAAPETAVESDEAEAAVESSPTETATPAKKTARGGK